MKQHLRGAKLVDEGATLDEGLYQLVRHMGYTWEELMREKLPHTLYTLEQIEKEAQEKKEEEEEMKKNMPSKGAGKNLN